MNWQGPFWNVFSGFLGALIGAIGGFLGSLAVQRRAQKEARIAAGRAVLAEMFANADRALSAKSTFILHEFTDFAWREQLPLVAHLLDWNELRTLVNTYDSAARAFENAKDVLQSEEKESPEIANEEQNLTRVGLWFLDIAKEWIAAMRILQAAVLDVSERTQLERDIENLEKRIV